MLYLVGFAFLSPVASVALVAAPLGLLLAFHRPGRGETVLAALCLGVAAWTVFGSPDGFGRVEGAWICLLTAGVVVALALRPPGKTGLIGTGLLAVALAAAMGTLLIGVTSFSFDELRWLAGRHFGMQARQVLEVMNRAFAGTEGGADTLETMSGAMDDVVGFVARFLPALILIQSLAALAASWALYRIVAKHPEGEPLPPLREFRFSDHLIWGVVVALAALVAPGARALRPLAGNLATFFGALYIVRGLGVVAALGAAAGVGGPLATLLGFIVTVFLLPLVVFGALALGVSDTWIDWRRWAKKQSKAES
ncbi:MAG: DUF2232 domain-containing protein [Gemmatimonadales bacterium]